MDELYIKENGCEAGGEKEDGQLNLSTCAGGVAISGCVNPGACYPALQERLSLTMCLHGMALTDDGKVAGVFAHPTASIGFAPPGGNQFEIIRHDE